MSLYYVTHSFNKEKYFFFSHFTNYIVAWVILLSLLKKLYPQFFSLSSLNRESCQYVKLHRVHLSPRVNKRASAPFKLVYSDVWGPCPVMFLTGFKYFVTFVDDFSLFLTLSVRLYLTLVGIVLWWMKYFLY